MKMRVNSLFQTKILPRIMGIVILALLISSPLLAAEGGGDRGSPWLDLLYQLINISVLVGIIYYYSRKGIGQFFISQAQGVKTNFAETRQTTAKTSSDLEDWKKKLEDLGVELEKMVESVRANMAQDRDRLIAEATAKAEWIKSHAAQQINQEMIKSRAMLRAQLADETVRLAEELIKTRMDGGRQQDIITAFMNQLEPPK